MIPLNGKIPTHTNWPNRQYTEAQIRDHLARGGNVGYRLKPLDLVVDIDPRNFRDERDLDLILPYLPPTRTVLTGGGGWHYYYRLTAPAHIHKTIKGFGPGIEFKTVGTQVVVPPSIHPDTGLSYKVAEDSTVRVCDYDYMICAEDIAPELLGKITYTPRPQTIIAPAMTRDQVTKWLAYMSIEDYREHKDWVRIMMAVHHASGGQGLELFLTWSLADPQYAGDEQRIRRRWRSL